MRKIKFMAWNKISKKMEYSGIYICLDGYWYEPDPTTGQLVSFTEKDCYELMQYTGLKDKNGKEIYEGDIATWYDVHLNKRFTGTVSFADGSFCIVSGAMTTYRWLDHKVEVIGNVWENKDLLEVR